MGDSKKQKKKKERGNFETPSKRCVVITGAADGGLGFVYERREDEKALSSSGEVQGGRSKTHNGTVAASFSSSRRGGVSKRKRAGSDRECGVIVGRIVEGGMRAWTGDELESKRDLTPVGSEKKHTEKMIVWGKKGREGELGRERGRERERKRERERESERV
ncbi:conserved hypothetical protein [Coccidioides posadasii str. Silveira]|uniref:Uncharacterized protein n=1 Tax=Coccidioides posadasii (strain RMSCC 757 / Silveira) TaxID=443226 RepID=E9CXF9_COCPS|nr:conserved hypothetical protein [Coccidioides posadasii str. Silveira]